MYMETHEKGETKRKNSIKRTLTESRKSINKIDS